MAIPFTPVVVNTGKEVVIFDAGNGAGRRKVGAGRLAAALGTAGFKAEQIDKVVITHFHGDHIGGLMEGGKPLFPNASYVAG
ncbi:MAG: MBL fold metallo-hydrolase, partial [Desulfobulbia bacterium]